MQRILGGDVSKDFLDTDTLPATQKRRLTDDPAGIAAPVEGARAFGPDRIVFESTGPYQKAAVGALLAAALPAVVVNARQVRDFAKAPGIPAQTGALDAGVLARFGQVVPTVVRPLPAPEIGAFQELYDRRGQLVRRAAATKNHRHAATSAEVMRDIDGRLDRRRPQAPRASQCPGSLHETL
jgi:transposase